MVWRNAGGISMPACCGVRKGQRRGRNGGGRQSGRIAPAALKKSGRLGSSRVVEALDCIWRACPAFSERSSIASSLQFSW